MADNLATALRRTHAWFESNGGWAPPDDETLAEWMSDGLCRCPDECLIPPAECCEHGLVSWWLVLRTLDRPDGATPLPPTLLIALPGRLDPRPASSYIAIMDAHHRALLAGDAGYVDPVSGLLALTARTLWNRRACCGRECRHCPFGPR